MDQLPIDDSLVRYSSTGAIKSELLRDEYTGYESEVVDLQSTEPISLNS